MVYVSEDRQDLLITDPAQQQPKAVVPKLSE